MLVDAGGADDAAVIRLDAERALVLTTDFFTPIVDDPADFGRIAAANALSDVYAMGGVPRWCLSLVAWPREKLPLDMLGEVLRGAAEIVAKAGASIVGGHSIDDPEPKFGLMVTGEVHPDRMTTNAAARPGDVLVLTKPIGSGIVATAIKRDLAAPQVILEAVRVMTTLNAEAARAGQAAGVRAATDVTGFGLLGHLGAMLRASGCAAEINAGAVPLLPGVRELVAAGCIPGGTTRNIESASAFTTFDGVDDTTRILLSDAQTSGGLLLCVPNDAVLNLPDAAVIGSVVEGKAGRITVHP